MLKFKIPQKDTRSKARVGKITTYHGVIDTPAFVPVGTQATVKSLTPKDLADIGVQVLFGNTYHLHLRPGEDVVHKFGGLGKFMGWMGPARHRYAQALAGGPTMTDSGGFQVFSLGRNRDLLKGPTLDKVGPSSKNNEDEPRLVKITNDGVTFRSHIDGSLHTFTPEKSIEIQKKLGADIILAFDECAPYPSSYEYTKEAMERTHKWAHRSLAEYRKLSSRAKRGDLIPTGIASSPAKRDPRNDNMQALFGIVQGGIYKDLREESARLISSLDFDGIAIGGVSVGESKKEMRDVLSWVAPLLPDEKPRHLLGIGEVDDIFDAVEYGIDMFDCVIPTRLGRTGFVFISPPEGNLKNRFRIDLNKALYTEDKNPLDRSCECYACKNFSRGYLHHLFRAKELLAYRLASYHNIHFIVNLTKTIRSSILSSEFLKLKNKWFK